MNDSLTSGQTSAVAVRRPVVGTLEWWKEMEWQSLISARHDCPHGKPYPYCLVRCKVDPCPIHLGGAARNGLDGGV